MPPPVMASETPTPEGTAMAKPVSSVHGLPRDSISSERRSVRAQDASTPPAP